jgi:nucleoside-diphosphate-sugar epimerase
VSKYLLTGVAGFIGSNIAQEILDNGNQVIGIDSFNSILYDNNIKVARLDKLQKYENFSFLKGNILEIDLDKILDGVDYVINEAGLPGQLVSWEKINEYFEANTFAAHKLYEHSIKNNIKVFIQASTSSVYGSEAVGVENQYLRPASPYGVTKLAAENLIQALSYRGTTKTIILRYFSVYGPGQRPDMGIYKFIESIKEQKPINIYGDGEQTRDFTFVSDIVNATLSAIASGKNNEIYNVSGGETISVNSLVELISRIAKVNIIVNKLDRPRGDQLNTRADTSKLRNHMAWSPKVGLELGLFNQIKWQGLV